MNAKKNLRFTFGEELANAISHLLGVIFGILALIFMLLYSVNYGNVWHIVSSAIFGSTIIILYLSSTLNHWLPISKAKEFFFNFDKISIYLLIAGTYTPLTLIALQGTIGWIIFGIEWAFAMAGILIISLKPGKFANSVSVFFIISYIVMGLLIVIVTPQVIEAISITGFIYIIIGGIIYIAGTLFFKLSKFKFHHLIWHIMVLLGTIFHFIAIYFFVLPIKNT